ncbi:MAG TPA: putative Ig domain-containing protein, partial [Gammaproteobacteria bacterium]|nr:putative Ig domain-containing protein [Gammaproteobacteria bacterium]
MKEPTKRLVTVLGIIAALIAGAPAFADLIFTSTPPTTATVGRPYSYTMMAANAPEDGGRHGPGERLRFVARALPVWLRFDGSDTIFGTPGPEDAGEYKVKLRAINKGTHVDQEFSIIVNAKSSSPGPPGAEGADLAAFVAVSPNPLTVGGTASWTATARNVANEDVAN